MRILLINVPHPAIGSRIRAGVGHWLDADAIQPLHPFSVQALERRVADVARIIIVTQSLNDFEGERLASVSCPCVLK